jgi:hypothetical protein
MKYNLIFLLVISLSVSAQEKSAVPRQAIRFSPFHAINFYPTIQIGYEHLLKNKITLYVEGGYVLDYDTNEDDLSTVSIQYYNKRGFKAKLEPRLYFYQNQRERMTLYGGVEFYYNYVDFDRNESVTECYDADCVHAFQRMYIYAVHYREWGFAPKAGIMIYIKNFFFDFNSGIAFRNIDYQKPEVSAPNQPEDNFDSTFDFVPIEEKRITWGPVLGLRIGYRIK